MALPAQERDLVRSLAARVAEIAAHPGQQERRNRWLCLNRLERVRPTIHIQALDANIWEELIPPETLQCSDPFCRAHELEMRKRIYAWEHFQDDRVTEDLFVCPLVIEGLSVGPSVDVETPTKRWGAHHYKSVIVEEKDLEKIQVEAEVRVNWEATDRHYQLLQSSTTACCGWRAGPQLYWFSIMDNFATWRGIQQMFTDLLDRPAWVHEAMDRIVRGHLNRLEQLEALGVLSPGHRNAHLGSGGYGWTEELAPTGEDGRVRLKDLWARAATQLFTDGISPEMHWEFAIQYEIRLLERFGLSCLAAASRSTARWSRCAASQPAPRLDEPLGGPRTRRRRGGARPSTPTAEPGHRQHGAVAPRPGRAAAREAFEKTRDNVVEVNLKICTPCAASPPPRRVEPHARQLAEEH